MKEATVKVTPTGALAGAFIELVKEAEGRGGWWRSNPLLSATGLDYHLHESGWEVRRIVPDGYRLVSEAELATALRTSHQDSRNHGHCSWTSDHKAQAQYVFAALVAAQEKGGTGS